MRRVGIFPLYFALAIVLAGAYYFTNQTSVRVPVIEPPKQTHHVVYFWVCDKLIGVILTTKTPVWWAVEDGTPPDNIVELMLEAESAGRSITAKYWHLGCIPVPLPKAEERT